MEYGIQLYSVRDITEKDLAAAIKGVADIGYKFVEFAGFFGHPAAEVKKMLDDNGLYCSGTHTGWQELDDDRFEETVAYHKTIGNKNIIIPGADLGTPEKLFAFVDFVNRVQPKLEAEGIALGYHNHSHEFALHSDGTVIYPTLELMTKVQLEVDTYWAYIGHTDPVKLLDRLGDRVKVIHVKDGTSDGKTGKPLGRGGAPVAAVVEKAKQAGIRMVVESETLDPDGLTEAKICFDYLKSLE